MEKLKFSNISKKRLIGIHPDLIFLSYNILKIMNYNKENNLPYTDIIIVEGLRTLEKQKYYLKNKMSKTLKSKHLKGLAVDIAPFKNGRILFNDKEKYNIIIEAGYATIKKYDLKIFNGYIKWGWDYNHWQIRNKKLTPTEYIKKFVC